MSQVKDPAPLYVDCSALCSWLLAKFNADSGTLERNLCQAAIDLLIAVSLALKDRRRELEIERADEHLIRLRVLLRLAKDDGKLDARQYQYALEQAAGIGRQLGGWARSLAAD